MNLVFLVLVCILISPIKAMEKLGSINQAHLSLEHLLGDFSEDEKKAIGYEYAVLKATLDTTAILTKTSEKTVLEKKKELQRFCINKHRISGNRASSGDEKNTKK